MNRQGCEYEARILETLSQGEALEALAEPLRSHVTGCPSCNEMISFYRLFQNDSQQLCAAVQLPNAGHVWWRARVAARRAAANRALRPILIAEKIAMAIGGGALIALLVFVAPWLAGQLVNPRIFSGAVVYSFSLSSLVVSSLIACLLLMAGALYALMAEK
ncbi:MAG: hypothetical protein EPN47_02940 [Acidobacteria bacterium]|nr:MAG: hypothetical protein EPN47_02940 [Acidobacteriota bacterium]